MKNLFALYKIIVFMAVLSLPGCSKNGGIKPAPYILVDSAQSGSIFAFKNDTVAFTIQAFAPEGIYRVSVNKIANTTTTNSIIFPGKKLSFISVDSSATYFEITSYKYLVDTNYTTYLNFMLED